ncbi:MAG: hypothetical protein F2534_14845 [Actinobacteria bacterium]|jgi:hypothetical protein|uniref:Unannotated protein n=1 Tax=freshwater metagenome TaxID=449393 RepID=A0A6J6ESG2_9ZZZZ|nr:hypothetical protein [Actinomycetota bacterium]
MGPWSTRSKLTRNAERLRSLRDELRVIDEQLAHLADEAADEELRALVTEGPVGSEPREARAHADAMARHRERVIAEIREREQRQDELLDRMNGA